MPSSKKWEHIKSKYRSNTDIWVIATSINGKTDSQLPKRTVDWPKAHCGHIRTSEIEICLLQFYNNNALG